MDKIGKILTLTSIRYSLTSKTWELPQISFEVLGQALSSSAISHYLQVVRASFFGFLSLKMKNRA
ncbi:hypothetical protein LEP1GSC193_0143 [Leptospira alstonii serovar Pingchang str. 80-412]|uniref:Uncharacterized protein n=2 Tax=Leptospira alstonii TaxID=28452 RepID=M6D5S7_9LEPT|nr:hypothetical protein LEP1GSC194_1650 [Leptospira alstonii serovar Sichuan str. 79601]EQA78863.1 hypothetical protein LEP1GSC193_0143 [Leptospira alstonii serovar Pingchang str. 80-412]